MRDTRPTNFNFAALNAPLFPRPVFSRRSHFLCPFHSPRLARQFLPPPLLRSPVFILLPRGWFLVNSAGGDRARLVVVVLYRYRRWNPVETRGTKLGRASRLNLDSLLRGERPGQRRKGLARAKFYPAEGQ